MSLPSPLELSALGASLLVLAGLAIFLLHALRIAIILGIAGAFVLSCAGVAHGYKQQGADEIQVKWDADKKERMDHLAQVIVDRTNAGAAIEQAARDQRIAADTKFNDLQARHVALEGKLRAVTVDNDLLSGLLDTVRTANASAPGVSGQPQGPSTGTAAGALCTADQLDAWFQQVAKQYNAALNYGDQCVKYYESQRRIN